MASTMVVKRTFIELADEKLYGEDAEYATRGRACSDSHLDLARKMKDFEEDCHPCHDFELTGLSDAETVPEAQANPGNLPCYGTPTTGTSDVCTEDTRSASWSRDSSKQAAHEESSSQSLAALLAENMRLASENQLLRENTRLIQENSSLRPKTNAGKTHAEPTPRQVEQLIMSAGPTPTSYFQEGHQVSMQPMHFGGYTYAVAPQMMMMMTYGAYAPDCEGSSRRRRRQKGLGSVAGAPCAGAPAGDNRTTVMLRNLPNNYTRPMVLNLLDTEGFKGKYDFFYLPIDFKTNACLGYAFVNLTSPSLVNAFWRTFDGFSRWVLPSRKVCGVTWSSPHQGLEAHVDRYRNSPVMHASVPEEYRPLVFVGGECVPFPGPTREPKAPRMRSVVEERC